MLELKKVSKVYETGDLRQVALREVSIRFRSSEFVSILGPSGSGKTTLLNIIGGLDQYTNGDLIINGISTKEYKDNDWDRYRNHSVGFVFQSYNLIPHQTVLANVELALTISGVSKTSRRNRAIKVLKEVGLGEHINKRPNQLSGGQMQRVAIARALINDPDVLLADEPTGALDTKTSVQIMKLLKEISKNKLVIMVTHNPTLAEEYSTRIIKISDGKITSDSNTCKNSEVDIIKGEKTRKSKKNYMNLKTALGLSFNNLKTKKTRTILTSFAGSIGIIGIALILSLSNGIQEYIDKVEEDTLSSYPLTIEKTSVDTGSLINNLVEEGKDKKNREDDRVYSQNIIGDLFTAMTSKVKTNDLKKFKEYLDNSSEFRKYTNDIGYSYDITMNLYKNDTSDIVQVNPTTIFNSLGMDTSSYSNVYSSMMSSYDVWVELMNNEELLKSQYDVVAGTWPSSYDEVVLIVNEDNEISDYTLYSLGILSQDELEKNFKKMTNGEEVSFEEVSYSFDELLELEYKLILNTDYYEKNGDIWINKKDDNEYMKKKINDAKTIKVVGIIKANEEAVATAVSGSGMIGYTHELTEYLINKINDSEIAKEQLNNPKINIFTNMEFSDEKIDMNNLTSEQQRYFASMSSSELAEFIKNYSETMGASYEDNLLTLGVVELDNPSTINIYPKDFESKESIVSLIDEYNKKQEKEDNESAVIEYTDLVGVLMNSVTSIVNVISYVLIAFVAISLIVSSIMIGIITYISVLERTKEIGILRAIGASKKDISRVFNAETIIEGTISGILGILVTLILNIPINIIIKNLVGISNISKLPILGGFVLVMISIVLTFIAGLIPSRIASRKDPVISLRTE